MNRPIVVVKVGTNVLTDVTGAPDEVVLKQLTTDIAAVQQSGYAVVFVSSGAMGFGRSLVQAPTSTSAVAERQLFSAVGQVALMQRYAALFTAHRLVVAQVLATKQDFQDRDHYFNMRHCFTALLEQGVIPIVNENDVVSVSELMFTDNDELAGLVASMLNAERLIILTNVAGVFAGDPAASPLIHELKPTDRIDDITTTGKSAFGRGGMRTKLTMARRLASLGIQVHIAAGKVDGNLQQILRDEPVGTVIRPAARRSNVKRRLGFADQEATATVTLNAGAYERLSGTEPVSLLPIGITHIDGSCEKGDLVRIQTADHKIVGIGRAEYGSDVLAAKLGQRGERAFIHYNYLVMYDR